MKKGFVALGFLLSAGPGTQAVEITAWAFAGRYADPDAFQRIGFADVWTPGQHSVDGGVMLGEPRMGATARTDGNVTTVESFTDVDLLRCFMRFDNRTGEILESYARFELFSEPEGIISQPSFPVHRLELFPDGTGTVTWQNTPDAGQTLALLGAAVLLTAIPRSRPLANV
jgi:hypothetical protein